MTSSSPSLVPLEPHMTSGLYNKNAGMQNAAMQPSIDLLVEAIASLPVQGSSERLGSSQGGPIRVVDLGASQGANSMQPCKAILEAVLARLRNDRKGESNATASSASTKFEVEIYHEDLPSNDWSSLLALVNDPELTYVPKASGKLSLDGAIGPAQDVVIWNSSRVILDIPYPHGLFTGRAPLSLFLCRWKVVLHPSVCLSLGLTVFCLHNAALVAGKVMVA